MRVTIRGDQYGHLLVGISGFRSPEDLQAIKTIPGRSWDAVSRNWRLPDTQWHADLLLNQLYATGSFTM
jgi:hypothetical protein